MRGLGSAQRDRGFALIAVVVFVVVLMALLTVTYERLHQAMLLEKESTAAHVAASALEEALGIGVARLQTGTPPESRFTCRQVAHEPGGVVHFQLTYDKLADAQCTPRGPCWSVEASDWHGSVTPESACPLVFSDGCGE